MTPKKNAARLEAEIAEILAKRSTTALSPDAVDHYMGGGCAEFAVALHREYGLQPVAIRGYYYTPKGNIDVETPHVAALTPAGDVVDASGVISTEAARDPDRWYFANAVFDVKVEPISVREAATTFGPAPEKDAVDAARRAARLIFGQHERSLRSKG